MSRYYICAEIICNSFMEAIPDRWSSVLIATITLFLIFPATGCSNKLSQQNNTKDSTSLKIDTAIAARHSIPGKPINYDSTKKYIYLTLDDGPQNGTMNCYHILQNLGVRASFFMIGAQAIDERQRKRADSILDIYPEFLLCNHSYTHANYNHYKSFYNNADSALRDIMKAQDSLHLPLKIFRTPANNSWAINGRMRSPQLTKSLCHLLDSAGYYTIGLDVEWRFKTKDGAIPVQNTQTMIEEVEKSFDHNENFVKNNLVILVHDRMFAKQQYADSLTKFITLLKEDKRYTFETIDHYPGLVFK